ncbi:SDR family NAD(P)-dependent oxidoreductase [Micromonospora sp. Llam7]|uniref:type I polyketide synthase n=1 Tax=Micromonospora tarapacensis TaxID=2835305 RepID=UPI001C831104|nr:type I polyketide synthase [Micromonospora tarapacensis]MBX7268175.1 SDR family NAD(P)-dependent oxidoreductase [Micromonospora tarapacensis]
MSELLHEHAATTGDKVAFADDRRALTYAQLERRTARLAGHLAAEGVGRGDRVAVFLANSVEVAESYLAVLRAAAIAVPLNPASSDAELAYLLDDSGAIAIITDQRHQAEVARVTAGRRTTLLVTGDGVPADGQVLGYERLATTDPAEPARDDLDLDAPAWMLYTSGTTGRPKGVLSTQRTCLWSVAACYVPILGLSPDDRMLWPLPMFHSLAHVLCVQGTVAVGSSVRIMSGFAAEDVLNWLQREPVTFLPGVPTMFHYLLQAVGGDRLEVHGLRRCLVTGSVASAALRDAFESAFGVPLLDTYGSTETCGAITVNWPTGTRVPGSCGLPVPGLTVRVVHRETGRDLPPGDEGEVWVRGPNIMLGYHDQPAATEQALRHGWYRTGDLAYVDAAGYLTITGRSKELIIRGGENIHPAEIEDVVRAVPGIADVAVAGRAHEVLGEVPVAYLIAAAPGSIRSHDVLAACREQLSYFKIPQELHEVTDIPRTSSGKIRRHLLGDRPTRILAVRIGDRDPLRRLEWTPTAVPQGAPPPTDWIAVGLDPATAAAAGIERTAADLRATSVGAQPPPVVVATADEDGRAIRDWLDSPHARSTRLIVVTRGAVSTADSEDVPDLAHAGIWGTIRSLPEEQRNRVVAVDLDEHLASAHTLTAALTLGEPYLAIRAGAVLVPRLVPAPVGTDAAIPALHPGGSALVTGTSTEAVSFAARRLVQAHGVRHVSVVHDGPVEAFADATVSTHATVRDALATIPADRPLTAVVHTDVEAVHDLVELHEQTRDLDIAAFVIFSSAAGTLGDPDRPELAAAAAHADALARHRAAFGLAAVSIGWGEWDPDSAEAATVFDVARGIGSTVVVTAGPSPEAQVECAPQVLDAGLLRRLVQEETAAVLGVDAATLPADRSFRDLGFDSVSAVRLRDRIAARAGLPLPATVIFDHPTPADLAASIHASLTGVRPVVQSRPAVRVPVEEPIAIVAMSCRLPGGVDDPEELWRLLADGGEAISTFPVDRGWLLERLHDPDGQRPGTTYVDRGGFLRGAAEFDADFFGISPREATAMDPQQRLLLETTWEALERAGIAPHTVRGARVGVYAGVMFHDYGTGLTGLPEEVEGYLSTGGAGSVASGRLAYTFGFEGPAITVDTACSSSLVAVHLAAQALRRGECTLAVAGGVTVMATPGPFVEFSRQRALAPDGRCKPFSADADGTVFAEGAGIVLLETLSDARRNGHPVLAVIRGSAVNQDGASNGLTAPSGLAQQRLIEQALANAGLTPSDVDAVEAHGTGTALGDPIEAGALLAVYGRDRDPDRPLWLGSLKSNIGHTQAAAGVAGLIKMVLAMRWAELPRTLHAEQPSTLVEWTAGAVRLLTESRLWEIGTRPRRAGVSSFGVSGTNAHVIIEEPTAQPEPAVAVHPPPGTVPVLLSGRGEQALRAHAAGLLRYLATRPDAPVADVAAAQTTRANLTHRAAVLASSPDELLAGLTALASGAAEIRRVSDDGAGIRAPFVFPGQGGQWRGMGAELLASSEVFAARARECADALAEFLDWNVLDVIRGAPDAPPLERVDVVQPALFTTMVALAALWRSYGVEPSAVVGHSQGEIAAACVAGGLSLQDGARIVALRSRAWLSLAGRGGMLAVNAPVEDIAARLTRWGDRLSIAAVNSPRSVTVSGEPAALDDLAASLDGEGVQARRIPGVDTAGHSAQVDQLRIRLLDALAPVAPRKSAVPFYSTVTGGLFDTEGLDATYWYRNIREVVRFQDAISALVEAGHPVFLEVSPHPLLRGAIEDTSADASVVSTLRREEGGRDRIAQALAEAHLHGVALDWSRWFVGSRGNPAGLPTYPFQRRRFWLTGSPAAADVSTAGLDRPGHPLLGAAIVLPGDGGHVFTGQLSTRSHPWLAEHRVDGVPQLAPAAFLDLALRAGEAANLHRLDILRIDAPLPLTAEGSRLQVAVGAADETGRRPVSVHACPADDPAADWTCHASGTLALAGAAPAVEDAPWPPSDARSRDVEEIHDRLAEAGLDHGPSFRTLRSVAQSPSAWHIETAHVAGEDREGFALDPTLLDAAAHVPPGGPSIVTWHGVTLHTSGASHLRCTAGADGSLSAVDVDGIQVVTVERTERVRPSGATVVSGDLRRLTWTALPAPSSRGRAAFVDDLAALAALAGESVPDLVVTRAGALPDVLAAVQAWLAEPTFVAARLAVVTTTAVATGQPGEALVDPEAAAVWGLVRVAQTEHPDRIVLVDLDDPAADPVPAARTGEPQLAVRNGAVLAPRLRRVRPDADAWPPALDPAGTVLLTGATGTIGRLLARHLVRAYGVRNLLLASRRGPAADSAAALQAELTELGATVTLVACDVADREQVRGLLASVPTSHPLTAVVHAAAALDDATIEALDVARLTSVLRPKADAARHLHELTRDTPLAAFVLFSSIAGTLGTAGQANYAAANAYLDGLAQHRQALGLPATALAWGLWADPSGMTRHLDEAALDRLGRSGVVGLSAEDGLALFDEGLRSGHPVLVPARLDMATLRTRLGATPSLLRAAPVRPRADTARQRDATQFTAETSFAAGLAALSEAERTAVLRDLVRTHAGGTLGYGHLDEFPLDRPFKDLGFDSLTAVELRNRLNRTTGLRLPTTVAYDHPTPAALVEHLRAVLLGGPGTDRETGAAAAASTTADRAADPVVIVGMSCRFPGGVREPADLWQLLLDERDAIAGFPTDRGWDLGALFDPDPDRAGTSYVRSGGFLHDAGDFDAEFFDISPREARAMDPQQRLLLEASWHALESARIDPSSLRGTATGVFAGTNGSDYTTLLAATPEGGDYLITGGSASVLSGRVAYTLGLEGPAISVDTACSSSLVALHLAARALYEGECTLALVGGVTVMSTPTGFVAFSRQRGLAPDGRCKPFAAAADGTGWAEGVGVLVVERLSQARRLGHPVLAVVRGSAVNQDGATNGLSAPSGPSQQRLIRAALADAGLTAEQVDVVEAHGTGTVLGDPIEAQALLATYGVAHDTDRPLRLGSVKSNLGHTQAAAGVAGVIKTVLALRHGVVPRTLHVDEPTPHVDWTSGNVRLATEAVPWPATEHPRRAGVSSFGVSGTNAHVILEQAPEPAPRPVPAEPDRPLPLVISARTPVALRARAAALLAADLPLADLAMSLATTRAALEHRAAVVAGDAVDARRGLAALAAGQRAPNLVIGAATERATTAFLFTGQGSQRAEMGAELYRRHPVFATALDTVCAELDRHLDRPVKELMFAAPGTPDALLLDQTGYTQPAIFALEVALYRLVESWGLRPDYLLGHSIGELVAAHVTGTLSLADASGLVAARGRLMQALPTGGAMAAIQASVNEVAPTLVHRERSIGIAAANGPDATVVSGDEQAVEEVAGLWRARGRRTRRLPVSHAFHSPLMEPMLAEFRAVAEELDYHEPVIPVVSNLTGAPVDSAEFRTPDYWVRHIRQTVRFGDGVAWLYGHGVDTIVELGPDDVLTALTDSHPSALCVSLLSRQRPEALALATACGRLYAGGVRLDWHGLLGDTGGRGADLPLYPLQRRRFWLDSAAVGSTRQTADPTTSWHYRIAWRPAPSTATTTLAGSLLVLVPRSAAADPWVTSLLDGLGAVGIELRTARIGGAADLADLASAPGGVLSLLALDESHGLALTLALLQTDLDGPLWSVTRGAVGTGPDDPPTSTDEAQVWGLGRVAALEQPRRWGGLVDLSPTRDERDARLLAAILAAPDGDDQFAVRSGTVLARRLVRESVSGVTPPARFGPSDTVLVTGGTGGIGAEVARRLAAQGVRRLVLTSRRGPDAPGAAQLAVELTESGVDVTVAACDISDRAAVAVLLDDIGRQGRPLTGVVHAAGVLDDGTIPTLSPECLATVLRPKVDGARILDELTRDLDLTAFVLFSSLAGMVGSAGQGNYAAANACLDAIADARRATGRPAVAVAWGAWAEVGMAADPATADRLRRAGTAPMTPDLALTALDRVLAAGTGGLVAEIDWPVFGPALTGIRRSRLFDEIPEAAPARPAAENPAGGLADLPSSDRKHALTTLVRAAVADVLNHDSVEEIAPSRSFKQLGFDSLTAVRLRNQLSEAIDRKLPATLVFDYPDTERLVSHLEAMLYHEPGATAPMPSAVATPSGEPIAIVGMACRFPGDADTPDALWDLLAGGREGFGPFPADRGWDVAAIFDPTGERPGSTYVRAGGFVRDATEFDAAFFGISPREALAMDPQQRLVLETSWEAIEDAGLDVAALRGRPTGVFMGTNAHDYVARLKHIPDQVEGYVGTGNSASVVSGRVAYTFGFEGPAVTVDTACSSSLVALHLAGQSLRVGECDLALVGGVTVMSTPAAFVEFSRQRGLAADGRCKSFAAAADGTGWGEGVGVVVLERLSDARRNNHRVLALVLGSAVNQDGASHGLTAPNGPSQERVIRQALANAGLAPGDVDAVEAHGTGTALGDPIEAQALLATYGEDRDRPLWLGSVKSNIGHTQAAAGIAGVMKMVLALRNDLLPPTLHVDEPNPHVDWAAGNVRLLSEPVAWKANGRSRRAGVSSFGISGTNAHVVIGEAPEVEATTDADPAPVAVTPLVLSARGVPALRARSAGIAAALDQGDADLAAVASTLVRRRSVLPDRAVVLGATRRDLIAGLRALAAGEVVGGLVTGRAAPAGAVGLVFSGQGSQWPGMGRGLAESFPVFRAVFDDVCDRFAGLREVVWGSDAAALTATGFAQPALFAVEVALHRLLESWGVRADVLLGHSVGEIAAAHVAGIFSLDDACRLVSARAGLMQELPSGGAMAVVDATEEEVLAAGFDVDVAAVNGPRSVVISGAADAVDAAAAAWRSKKLRVSHAFHSRMMEPMLEPFAAAIAGVSYHEPTLRLLSTADVDADMTSTPYWVGQVRRPVRYADALAAMLEREVTTVIEVGPGTGLSALVQQDGVRAVSLLRKDRDEVASVLTGVAEAFTAGAHVDWSALAPARPPTVLPAYPFQRTRYWLDETEPDRHQLLDPAVHLAATDQVLLTGRLSLAAQPWLADHRITGRSVVPGTGLVELALSAADAAGRPLVEELTLHRPLVIPDTGSVDLQVIAGPDGDDRSRVTVHARTGDGSWTCHATGMLADDADPSVVAETVRTDAWPPAGAEPLPIGDLYERLADRGLEYGPLFQGLRRAWRHADDLFAEVVLPDPAATSGFTLHPALLDAALHTATLAEIGDSPARLPFLFTGVRRTGNSATALRVHVRGGEGDGIRLDATDHDGVPVITIASLVSRPVDTESLGRHPAGPLYRLDWQPLTEVTSATAQPDVTWLGTVDMPDLDGLRSRPAVPAFVMLRVEPGDGELAARTHRAVADVLTVVQHWLAEPRWETARLVVVAPHDDPAGSAVWGLVRSVQAEQPGRVVLADLHGDHLTPAVLAALHSEPQVIVRGREILVPRLLPAPPAEETTDAWPADGTVLVTGASGTLGALVARHLARTRRASRLVLLSRQGAEAGNARELADDLAAVGCEARFAACDVADREALARVIADYPPTAVVHAAGVLDDGVIGSMTPERLAAVLRPKVDGATNLHELTRDLGLTAFVLFSSASAVIGGPGQANYAAANGFQDGLARERHRHGLPAHSLAWGLWAGSSGMTAHLDDVDLRRIAQNGIVPLTSERGLDLLDRALGAGLPDPVLVPLDRTVLRAQAARGELPHVLRALVGADTRVAREPDETLADRLAALPRDERAPFLLDLVRGHVAAVLGHTGGPDAIESATTFRDLGFDSLTAVQLRNQLAAATGLRLPATLVFDHPTAAAIAVFVHNRLVPDEETAVTAPREAVPETEDEVDVDDLDVAVLIAKALQDSDEDQGDRP